jgi:multicomponent Na+:H+ antiporter subunit G
MNDVLTAVLMLTGATLVLLAAVGALRMPDLFTRMQAATKAAALGTGLMLLAVAVHFGQLAVATRALATLAFLILTAPVAAHMLARAAYRIGVPLWEGTVVDEWKQRMEAESIGEAER